jgi:hypothetical protein
MDEQKDFGENEGNKGDWHGVELALLGFNCQATNRTLLPHDQPMVLWSNIGFGRYWFGVLPLHVGHLFNTGYSKKPWVSCTRDLSLIWIYEAGQIYKWRWERRL